MLADCFIENPLLVPKHVLVFLLDELLYLFGGFSINTRDPFLDSPPPALLLYFFAEHNKESSLFFALL